MHDYESGFDDFLQSGKVTDKQKEMFSQRKLDKQKEFEAMQTEAER